MAMRLDMSIGDVSLIAVAAILIVAALMFVAAFIKSGFNVALALQVFLTWGKKYWSIALVAATGIVVLLMKFAFQKKAEEVIKDDKKTDKDIDLIKTKIQNAQTIANIEIAAAQTKNTEVKKQLDQIKKIPDEYEKAKRLADLL
jgi:apolipoprotein N-acyltransferase